MTIRRAKHAIPNKYYNISNIRYLCYLSSDGQGYAGFVNKDGKVQMMHNQEVEELPPECDSFDWVPPEPDP